MRGLIDLERPVRLTRRIERRSVPSGKRVCRKERMRLTIPSRYKEVVGPFLDRDLKVNVRRIGNSLIIDAKPV
jgi:hypothetical protein